MTKLQRVRGFLFGALTIMMAIILVVNPEDGYDAVLGLLSLSMAVSAIGALYHYFTMARFMVGGKYVLYRGVIFLDFAILTGTLTDLPEVLVLIYLVIIHAFSGAVELLRANEGRMYGARSWKVKFLHGCVNVLIAIACVVFINNHNTAVIIYSIGLIYSGITRIANSFRKTTFIYIQ